MLLVIFFRNTILVILSKSSLDLRNGEMLRDSLMKTTILNQIGVDRGLKTIGLKHCAI